MIMPLMDGKFIFMDQSSAVPLWKLSIFVELAFLCGSQRDHRIEENK